MFQRTFAALLFMTVSAPLFAVTPGIVYQAAGTLNTTWAVYPRGAGFSFSSPNYSSNLSTVKVTLSNQLQQPAVRVAAARRAEGVANTISVGLYANASNSPGTLIGVIGTMPDSSLTTTPTSYSFNPSTTYPLTPNTRYWIGITVSGTTSQAAVEFQTNNTGIGIANEFIAFSLTPPNTDSNADYEAPFMGEVNVTPATPGVPVPPAIMLSMIGIACLGMYFGWRRMAGRAAV